MPPLGPTEIYIGIFLFIIYLALLFSAGLMSFRRGHKVIGIVGFFFPPIWLAGALMPPKRKQATSTGAPAKPKKKEPQPAGVAPQSKNTHSKKKRRRK